MGLASGSKRSHGQLAGILFSEFLTIQRKYLMSVDSHNAEGKTPAQGGYFYHAQLSVIIRFFGWRQQVTLMETEKIGKQ